MRMKHKIILLCLLLVAVTVLAAGCGEKNPYDVNNKMNYNVSIRFDAGEGIFTTNTKVIVDSYNISQMKKNGEGQVEIPLLAPDDARRESDKLKATCNGHFLVGWYAKRTETKDAAGNVTYTYSEPWDFENDRLKADPKNTYDAHTPVLTLYAAWLPLYEIEFVDRSSGSTMGTYSFDPKGAEDATKVQLPAWDLETGSMNMYQFPKKEGFTFKNAYYDAEGAKPVDSEFLTHPGTWDLETATAKDSKLRIYIDWTEGQWFRISTADQFIKNFSLNGNYEILSDLDFTGKIWPTALMYGSFAGTVNGNGHTFSNIELTQTDNAKVNAGMFGNLTEKAVIRDVQFNNVTFTVKKGARVAAAFYGLLAGSITEGATLQNVTVTSSQILIDSSCLFADDYAIGLICGMGESGIDHTGISCSATGSNPEKLLVTSDDDGMVKLEFL